MNQIKIGKFIAERRKLMKLTQVQLAEMLNITDRAVSKWETGKSLPDAAIMLDLCKILKITVNDLLNGEVINMKNYNKQTEEMLIEMVKEKEEMSKRLLTLRNVIVILTTAYILITDNVAYIIGLDTTLGTILFFSGVPFAIFAKLVCAKISQTTGYYECKHCNHRYVPTYNDVTSAQSFFNTRYMKCPECGKKSWQKKIISNEEIVI